MSRLLISWIKYLVNEIISKMKLQYILICMRSMVMAEGLSPRAECHRSLGSSFSWSLFSSSLYGPHLYQTICPNSCSITLGLRWSQDTYVVWSLGEFRKKNCNPSSSFLTMSFINKAISLQNRRRVWSNRTGTCCCPGVWPFPLWYEFAGWLGWR